jgi:hypothetical protein
VPGLTRFFQCIVIRSRSDLSLPLGFSVFDFLRSWDRVSSPRTNLLSSVLFCPFGTDVRRIGLLFGALF